MGVSLPSSCAGTVCRKWTAWNEAGKASPKEEEVAAKFFKITPLSSLGGAFVSCELSLGCSQLGGNVLLN